MEYATVCASRDPKGANTQFQSLSAAAAAAAAKLLQSCPTLCGPIDGSPLGSSVPGILQARILEWVAISFSNACTYAKSLQSCPTLCDSMDSSQPSSPIHGFLQARILEWIAISFFPLSVTLLKQFCKHKNPAGETICAAKNHERTLYSVPASFSHSS